jgi:peptidase E
MTKFILHGGATRNKTENNRKFFHEMTDGLPDPVNILCAYFAKEKEKWQELFKEDKINFSSAAPGKVLNFFMANVETQNLTEQIKKADVIYLRGGTTGKLQAMLGRVKNLKELFKGKVVAGSSAGAYVLATYYPDKENTIISKGLELLPIKTFAHYTEEHKNQLEILKKYGEELEVYAIPEEKFEVIEK